MFFSEYFEVESTLLHQYGAIDISLICDMPLFVDPMLIFNSDRTEYKQVHENIIKYLHFLATKANRGLQKNEIRAWFKFSEVKNNWLGYSLVGNGGLALGDEYAQFLYDNIGFAISTNNISQSIHIEKIMLLYQGSGKDKISDLTVNLIKEFLLEFTQTFAVDHIKPELRKNLYVERAYFNYETESFVSKEYMLPYFINSKGQEEYVLLTPIDILREDEPSINRLDFYIVKSVSGHQLKMIFYVHMLTIIFLKPYKNMKNNKDGISVLYAREASPKLKRMHLRS